MVRKVYKGEGHYHYLTFSCYGRRSLLRDKEAIFNLYSEKKPIEKLEYMHLNPVRAGLVEKASDYLWSSCGYYEEVRSVGVSVTKPK